MFSPHRTAFALAICSTALLAGCDSSHSVHNAPPEGTVAANRQPVPQQPLFGAPIVKGHDVLPHAKADPHEPLPAAAPLPSATAAAEGNAPGPNDKGGSVNPAAGMGATVTDSKGSQHDGDGK